MGSIWEVLELEPTRDVADIRRAYAKKAQTCHPEENPEGFLRLREAYRAALDYAEGRDVPPETLEEEPSAEEEGWQLQAEIPESLPNPYEGGEAIQKFLELYTGK